MTDNKLKFHDEFDLVNIKLRKLCGITYRVSTHLDLSTAKNLYFACMHSTLKHRLVVRDGTCISTHSCDKPSDTDWKCQNLSRYFPEWMFVHFK